MVSGNLMELVRELKTLNERKKAGEALSDEENVRRKELKEYLRVALDKQKGGSADGAAVASQSGPAMSASGPAIASPAPVTPAPVAAPAPVLTPAPAPSTPAKPAFDPRKAFMITSGKVGIKEEDVASMPTAPPKEAANPKYDARNAYAIKGFDDLMEKAASSDAVAATFKHEKLTASKAELSDAEARAEAAIRANKKRERTNDTEAIAQQRDEIAGESGYTPPEVNLALEDYYGEYQVEGYDYVPDEGALELNVIDPRELDLHRSGLLEEAAQTSAAVPAGLAFLDDFAALYTSGILPAPEDEDEPDVDDPNLLIAGKRKVTVHLLNGTVKRGAIRRLGRGDLGFALEPIGTGRVEEISLGQVKAVFIHTRGKDPPPSPTGRILTVTFRDRRTVQGSSDDYQPGVPVFTLIPPVGRGGTAQYERIIVNSGAVAGIR